MLQKLKENPITENIGKRWSDNEINTLINEIKNNISLDDIALNHKRTIGSINSRLLNIGYLLLDKKLEIIEICKITEMSIELIKNYIIKDISKLHVEKLNKKVPTEITET